MRYYFNENSVKALINQILFDKRAKIIKYGKTGYKNLMIKNKMEHKKDTSGFWSHARFVTKEELCLH